MSTINTQTIKKINKIDVKYQGQQVGVLALQKNGICAFQYNQEWIINGFSLNPLELPLNTNLHIAKMHPFDGMFGVIMDSLPDGWGKLITDRKLQAMGINHHELSNFSRLTLLGSNGKGALEYFPKYNDAESNHHADFDRVAAECKEIFNSAYAGSINKAALVNIDEYFYAAGSSGGARPKINALIDGEEWIVKFASSLDPKNIAEIEFAYMECAKKCGIEVPEHRMLPSKKSEGYFAVKRFDRFGKSPKIKRIHTCSASGLLGVSHRIPSLDYLQLMQLTWALTHDSIQMQKMFRLMCFNVFAHNRDDHSNNFSFLYSGDEESTQKWKLSPAYDLTYSNSLNGEHATTINGNGLNPNIDDIMAVANEVGLNKTKALNVANEIKEIVNAELRQIVKEAETIG